MAESFIKKRSAIHFGVVALKSLGKVAGVIGAVGAISRYRNQRPQGEIRWYSVYNALCIGAFFYLEVIYAGKIQRVKAKGERGDKEYSFNSVFKRIKGEIYRQKR